MRERLSALPLVEIRSIKPDQSRLRVSFGVNDKTRVNEPDLQKALGSRYGQGMKILSVTDEKLDESSKKSTSDSSAQSSARSAATP